VSAVSYASYRTIAADSSATIRLSEIISALSAALDLTEGQPMGHAVRSCIIGMKIAEHLGLTGQERSDLYYALLLKDSGCSSNSARLHAIMGSDDRQSKSEVKLEDWRRVSFAGVQFLSRNVLPDAPWPQRLVRMAQVALKLKRNNTELIGARCQRGAQIARMLGLSEGVAEAIYSLDEHWDGGGFAQGKRHQEIPVLARIMNVSQTIDVFAERHGARAAIHVVTQRAGRWFDPEIVPIVRALEKDDALWQSLKGGSAREQVLALEPGLAIPATQQRIDDICNAFAQIIDAKSPYTSRHSTGVAAAASAIAEELGLSQQKRVLVRRAALLHDIGKLGVSNTILEKPGKLTSDEWELMKQHPVHTFEILRKISGFEHLAYVAAAHHERLDGKGYPEGLTAEELTLPARIIAVADVFQALTEKRPYRDVLPVAVAFEMMDEEANVKIDGDCLAALKRRKAVEMRSEHDSPPSMASSARA
jgi:putative nucleotidyltransferase with HDIG domain